MPRNGDGVHGSRTLTRKSDRFLAGLEEATAVILVSHVHPDPDSLGSMMGLAHLVETCLGKSTRLTRDGLISRAENRAMVELLDIELEAIEELEPEPGEAVVMVDSQPNTGRHTFAPNIPLHAVIDHHETPGQLDDVAFVDVRRGLGSTCSIVTSYLIEQDIPLPSRLATGLF
ncbi:MAG TPA: DHH family phosphoesterase, partial [Gemmataceae bacterium]|nr:DHH family phosphoesterase [Gemmataceae bacterium]